MKQFIFRASDGMLIKEYKNERDLIQPEDCYVDNVKPRFGFDPDIWYGNSTGIEKMNGGETQRKRATMDFMLKIAKHKISAFGLTDTPEKYVQKCQEKS